MNVHVIRAIFKRNFVSYFSNPTGYVFICVFVLLSSFAAFWPNEFFNANLANLDQLNQYLPYILLVFIPAITMSIWADERRQGTDELLLTIPAGDFDVVLGKYLAAVAIYTVSLLFSLVCNYVVLLNLGEPDLGLFLGTYFGYWMVGLAMLAIGMVASFLTGNLTVGFMLGVLFNAPLGVCRRRVRQILASSSGLSIAEQFRDFSRGVISFASVGYFLAIVALMLYLSMVLIGRRHWRGGARAARWPDTTPCAFLALVAVVISLNVFLTRHDRLRVDVTSEQLSSLSPQTRELIAKLDAKRPVVIEDFVSPNVPESYVQTRLNLLSTLRELQAVGGDKVQAHPPRRRAVQRGGHAGRAAVRHPPRAGRVARSRRADARRDLPGPGLHLRSGQGRAAVRRPGHSGRVRIGPLDRHGQPAEAQEARRADDRRQALRRRSTCKP